MRKGLAACLLAAAACGFAADDPVILFARAEPIRPLPAVAAPDAARVALGRQLFDDTLLSANRQVACRSCHVPEHGGSQGSTRPLGANGRPTPRNAPTLWNAVLRPRFGWDGRHERLRDAVREGLQDPAYLGLDGVTLSARLERAPAYADAFRRVFRRAPDIEAAAEALEAYIATLVTPDAPFDRFMRGDAAAIGAGAREGYDLFKRYGCASCHNGVHVGSNVFQPHGVFEAEEHHGGEEDPGRYAVTRDPRDRGVFLVPSLRNVERTAPYMHDGEIATLADAVREMAEDQLNQALPEQHVARIVEFLRSLTGRAPDGGAP